MCSPKGRTVHTCRTPDSAVDSPASCNPRSESTTRTERSRSPQPGRPRRSGRRRGRTGRRSERGTAFSSGEKASAASVEVNVCTRKNIDFAEREKTRRCSTHPRTPPTMAPLFSSHARLALMLVRSLIDGCSAVSPSQPSLLPDRLTVRSARGVEERRGRVLRADGLPLPVHSLARLSVLSLSCPTARVSLGVW